MKQLELFENHRDSNKDFDAIRNEWNKVRKALFQQNAELRKMYQELAHEHMILKLNICKGKIVL